MESLAACIDCSPKYDAEMGLSAAWGPELSGDKQIGIVIPRENEWQGLMPMLKALDGIWYLDGAHICPTHFFSYHFPHDRSGITAAPNP